MAGTENDSPLAEAPLSLDDAAALLLQLDASELEELGRVERALARLAAELPAPPLVRAVVADAASKVREVVEGRASKPDVALEEAGQLIGDAMFVLGATGAPPAATPSPAPAAASAPAPATPAASTAPAPVTASDTLALPADVDPVLLEGFVDESRDYLEAAESAMLLLESDPDDAEACNTVFRAFHTIKGTSAFLGLEEVAEFAHWAESLLSRVRDREIRFVGGYADLSLHAVDLLKAYVGSIQRAMKGEPLRRPDGYDDLLQLLLDPEAAGIGEDGGVEGGGLAAEREEEESAPERAEPGAGATAGGRKRGVEGASDSWIRVKTDRLDRLIDMIGELVIAQAIVAEDGVLRREENAQLARNVAHGGKIVRELQDLSIAMRMVPLKATFQKMARVVRDVATKQGKVVEFVTAAEETEIDRNMVDVIGDPLVHMVRNAVDHGLELPAEREAKGKPRAGTVRLSAYHAGGNVVIELSDDGRGLDREKILAKAISRGLIESERGMSDSDIYNLIFAPGFSTAEQVTDVSGRGVGMDVVKRNIERVRGRIEIRSEPGQGSVFSLRLPLTLAMTDGMLVRVGAERYVVPTISIQMSFRPTAEMLSTVVGRGEMVLLRGDLIPIVRLHQVFEIAGAVTDPTEALLVVIGVGERRYALLVDELLAQQQVVAKSLGAGVGRVPGVSGGAILGDGRVGLILDPAQLVAILQQGGAVRSVA